MREATKFPVLDADPETLRMLSEATLEQASATVVSLDEKTGLTRFDGGAAPILKLVPPEPRGHPFFVRAVPGRERRPRGPATDPLCIDAARAIGQHYIVLDTSEGPLITLANPFPYMEDCVTWATLDFVPQRCHDESDWRRALRIVAKVCAELEWAVVGFNETVGNSLDHLHVVSHRPPSGLGPYPVQIVASTTQTSTTCGITHLGPHNGYATDVWRVCFETAEITADSAAALAAHWAREGGEHASANAGAVVENGRVALYVVPRHRFFTAVGWHSNLAFLEMLGVLIAGQRADYLRVKRGQWAHDHIGRVISSVRPHGASHLNLCDAMAR